MKLLATINRTYVRVTALAVAGGALLFFFVLRHIIRSEQKEELADTYYRVKAALEQGAAPVQFPPLLEVRSVKRPVERLTLTTVLLPDPVETNEKEPFRELSGPVLVEGKPHRIIVRVSLLESEDLLATIGVSVLGLGLLLFAVLWAVNRRQARALWRPFQHNLAALRGFSPAQSASLELADCGIDEFDELTQTLHHLTEKARTDFRNLREFTENASHEIQTPLAVIRSKLEWLAQADNLSDDQFATIQAIDRAAGRLSRLNQGLILLSRIENRQFPASPPVDLPPLIREHTGLLEAFTEEKRLAIALDLPEHLTVALPPALADVVVKNLLENAVRYSPAGSAIRVAVRERTFLVANPGEQALEDPERLFRRFVRRNGDAPGLGLGLALVKKITDAYGLEMGYRFEAGEHVFWISFPKKRSN